MDDEFRVVEVSNEHFKHVYRIFHLDNQIGGWNSNEPVSETELRKVYDYIRLTGSTEAP